jgi:hypothetical protein
MLTHFFVGEKQRQRSGLSYAALRAIFMHEGGCNLLNQPRHRFAGDQDYEAVALRDDWEPGSESLDARLSVIAANAIVGVTEERCRVVSRSQRPQKRRPQLKVLGWRQSGRPRRSPLARECVC